ncbi:hypothetical protein MMC20_003473 [Loxospora ochrophaea]|nr:hypothetical protein [Loxospora ochrophaea]
MSWFWRGFQSAVFYYVSCAPCTKLNYRRKRRKDNQRAKAEKLATEAVMPELYRHPSPFSTNIYWREEMALGPGPPPRKGNRDRDKGSRAGSRKDLNTAGQGSSVGASSADTITVEESSEATEMVLGRQSDEGWNRKRYQRPDEMLWGIDFDSQEGNGQSNGFRSIGRSGTRQSGNYYFARNPAVNDLHPPVVSTHPTHKSETKWMLQPPPSAKIMEGKARENRNRSHSGTSYGSRRTTDSLNHRRQAGEQPSGDKVKPSAQLINIALPLLKKRRARSADDLYTTAGDGQHEYKDVAFADNLQSPVISLSSRSSLNASTDRPRTVGLSTSSNQLDKMPSEPRAAAQRPPLSTIASSSDLLPTITKRPKPRGKTNKEIYVHHRPALSSTDSTSSLNALQELAFPASSMNARVAPISKETSVGLPPTDAKEASDLTLPECESRFPVLDFQFPTSEFL